MDRRVSTANHLYSLQGCVTSLRASCSLLESSIASLDAGIHTFPRVSKLLQANRHFEVVGESEVVKAHQELAAEVEPQMEDLLRRAEQEMARLERKEKNLSSKSDLQQVRLHQRASSTRPTAAAGDTEQKDDRSERADSAAKVEKRKNLRLKRERLLFSLQRLELEEDQKRRQLRQSAVRA